MESDATGVSPDVELEILETNSPSSVSQDGSQAPAKSRRINMSLFPEPFLQPKWIPATPQNKGVLRCLTRALTRALGPSNRRRTCRPPRCDRARAHRFLIPLHPLSLSLFQRSNDASFSLHKDVAGLYFSCRLSFPFSRLSSSKSSGSALISPHASAALFIF